MVDFLFALAELFCNLLRLRNYEAKCVQLGCFHRRVDLFALKFYLDRVVPIDYSWHRKLETPGYPMAKTAPLCVPSF